MRGLHFHLAHTHNQCQVEPDYKGIVDKKCIFANSSYITRCSQKSQSFVGKTLKILNFMAATDGHDYL